MCIRDRVIIDPIQAYLGADVDMNRANEVRPIFMRLGPVSYTHLDVYKRQVWLHAKRIIMS